MDLTPNNSTLANLWAILGLNFLQPSTTPDANMLLKITTKVFQYYEIIYLLVEFFSQKKLKNFNFMCLKNF
jgi:hypothetical protein